MAERDKAVSVEMELAKELNVMHSELIVSALHHAYKYYRGPLHRRRQLHIACLLADEHFSAGAFDLALRFYGEISQSRGLHNWSRLLYHVRMRAAECAERLNLSVDFVRHSLALLMCTMPVSVDAAQREQRQRQALETAKSLTEPLSEQQHSSPFC